MEAWDEGLFRVRRGAGAAMYVAGAEEADAGADADFGVCEAGGEFAEVFYAEGRGEIAVVFGEADLLEGFAAGGLEGGFEEGVCSTCG